MTANLATEARVFISNNIDTPHGISYELIIHEEVMSVGVKKVGERFAKAAFCPMLLSTQMSCHCELYAKQSRLISDTR